MPHSSSLPLSHLLEEEIKYKKKKKRKKKI
jgi:hypothetical protein